MQCNRLTRFMRRNRLYTRLHRVNTPLWYSNASSSGHLVQKLLSEHTHTHTHTTDCCTWITTVVSIRSSTTQFSRPAGCRTFITVFFVVVESVNKSLKAASLFHTPRVCCPGCRRHCSSTHAGTPPALPSAKQHFGWHDFASIPYITTTWSWWLKTRHRRSGRIPRTVYRYFWAYPFFTF